MRRLLGFLKPHWPLVLWLATLNLALAGLMTVAPIVTKAIVDNVIDQKQVDLLPGYLVILFAVAAGRAISQYFYGRDRERLGQYIVTDIRTALYKKLLALSYSFYDNEQTGRIMSRITSDVDSTRMFLAFILVDSVLQITIMIAMLIALLTLDVTLALIAIVPSVASGISLYILYSRWRMINRQIHEQNAVVSGVLQDSLSGIKVVKAFAQEGQEQNKYELVVKKLRELVILANDRWYKRFPYVASVPRFMQLALIAIGGMQVIRGDVTLGTLVASISFTSLMLNAANALGTQLTALGQSSTAAVRIFEMLDEPVRIKTPPNAIKLGELRGDVSFENVTFKYPTAKANALKGIDLHVPAGSSLAVVGATGSGKSTLVHLIGRYYDPTFGSVRVDGQDVRKVDLDSLRGQIGIVAQDALLFSATIAENIAFGRPDATQEEIERAAKLAQAHEFIMSMPDRYQSDVGERGLGLSGGQRQRIAIARAILLNPKILIMDDSMSAVDSETERLLQDAIGTVMQGRTTILIAHRMSTVQKADHIAVLREGEIVEYGTHDELMRSGGYYQRVLELQRMTAAESMTELLSHASEPINTLHTSGG
jgi:ABC-type multidrug transport system fused ATPase/permease subunit